MLLPRSILILLIGALFVAQISSAFDFESNADGSTDTTIDSSNTDTTIAKDSTETTVTSDPKASVGTSLEATTENLPTTTPKSVPVGNDLAYTLGPRKVMQNALVLNNNIIQLQNQLKTMSDQIAPNSTLITQLNDMSQNATIMQNSLNNILITYNATVEKYNTLQAQYNSMAQTYTCLANSACVTAPTTVAPSTPSTTPAPACPAVLLNVTKDTQTYTRNLTKVSNCSVIFNADNNPISIQYTAQFTGVATLTFTDGVTSQLIKEVDASVTEKTNLDSNTTIVIANLVVGDQSSENVEIFYNTYDSCKDVECGTGDCIVVNGNNLCQCKDCYTADDSGKCTVAPACSKRLNSTCKVTADGKNQCKIEENADGECAYNCYCGESATASQSCDSSEGFLWKRIYGFL